MAVFQVTVQQVSFQSEELPEDSSSVDSLSSVVDPNVDFLVDKKYTAYVNQSLSDFAADLNSISGSLCNSEISETVSPIHTSKEEKTYPEISLAVAQYMNNNNPDLHEEAKRYLNMEFSKTSVAEAVSTATNGPTSPLHSLSISSEALALQQSVIGNSNVTPVSSDIVAQVVANTKQLLEQKNISCVPFKNAVPLDHLVSVQDSQLTPTHKVRLFKYPSEIISSTVEKHSWFSNSSYEIRQQTSLTPSKEVHVEKKTSIQSNSVNSINNNLVKKNNSAYKSNIPTVHTSRSPRSAQNSTSSNSENVFEIYPDSSAEYETESSISEKFEVESIFSETFETESNFSEVSGIDDEMFQMRKHKNIVVPDGGIVHNGTQVVVATSHANTSPLKSPLKYFLATSDKSVETDESYHFQLLREKAHLEGRLESVSCDQSSLIKERDHFRSLAISLEAQIKSQQKQLENAILEKSNALKALDSQDLEQKNWDSVIKEYQSIVESKNNDIKGLKEDLSECEQANVQSKINYEELKVEIDSKEGAISGLKKKVAELHVELQILLQGKIQLENELKNVRLEMETLQKSKEWFQEQLHSTQASRNKMHRELVFLQSNQATLSNSLERTEYEKNQLRQELIQAQERAVAEKEVLMKHLETIEADMKERESLFDDIQRDKGTAEAALVERIRKLEEEKLQSTNLSLAVSDFEYQVKLLRSEIGDKDKMLDMLGKDKVELSRQNAILQKSFNDKVIANEQLMQEIKDLNAKIKEREISASRAEDLMSTLQNERTAIEVALAAANEEKRVVNESLKAVSDTLNKLINNFKIMKADLIAKTSQTEQLTKEKLDLQEALKKSEEAIFNLRNQFKQQAQSENHNRNVLLDDLKKKKNDVENVLNVYSKDLLNYQQTVENLCKEKAELGNKIKDLKDLLNSVTQNNNSLTVENTLFKKRISELEETEQKMNNRLSESADQNNRPKDAEAKLQVHVRKVLYRKLKEKIKECDDLRTKLEEKSISSQSVSETLCESCPAHLELLSCQNTIKDLESQLADFQKSREEQAVLLKNNENVIIELEREKGKATGLSEKYESLRQHLSELEKKLGEKDSQIVHLSSENKSVKDKMSDLEATSNNQIANQESILNKERASNKNLRQQIFQEKRSNSHLQRNLSSMKSALEQANQIADSKKQEVESLQAELSVKMQAELKHRAETEHFQTEIRVQKSVAEKIAKELEEIRARDPALAEQLKAVSWKLKEKANEVESLKEKLIFTEEKNKVEIDNLKKALQSVRSEVESLKSELKITREEKFSYQNKVIELRKALKSKLGELESKGILRIEKQTSENGPTIQLNIPDPEVTFDETYVNSLLQKSMDLCESRPLNNLQECLNSLKEEMMQLQKKIIENSESS